MPRKAPTQIVEQRITLGSYERAALVDAIAAQKRQAVGELAVKAVVPITVAAGGIAATFIVMNTWQKVNDLIPSFDGFLEGVTNVMLGDQAKKEAILREAELEAEQDGKPLTFTQKVWNRFAVNGLGGIGFY